MERSIDELLSDEPVEPVEAEQEAEPTPEPEAAEPAAEGRPRGPDGKFIKQTGVDEEPKAQAPEEPAQAAPPAADQLPPEEYKALRDERRKRQEAEARAAQLEAQWLAAQQQKPAEPAPDFWDNPQAVIASQVQQAVMQALEAQKQQQTMERINESEVAAKGRYTDYDDAFRAFQQAATANPLLVKQMTAASDPAEFAYKTGKTALELSQVGSIDALLERERAKWEAEARAAMPAPPALPSTTATDGSIGSRSGPEWSGPGGVASYLA